MFDQLLNHPLLFSGLNCAEAVNFAPADWLPYGGFGSELYQHYRKPAVLSHEELLCVVAKVSTFLLVSLALSLIFFILIHRQILVFTE